VIDVITAAVHADLLESPAGAKRATDRSKSRRMQGEALPSHLRHVARIYPAYRYQRRVLIINDAPLSPRQFDRRGPGGVRAPGVVPVAELQPAPECHRAVQEAVVAPGES